MNQRRLSIIQDFAKSERLSVAWLAKQYKVSQVTIRNDLKQLENQGLLRRVHGGASTADEQIDNRLSTNFSIKWRIAEAAAELVQAGETVMIESGSTNALLAKKLGEKRDITIITNSCFIASYVRDCPNLNLVLLGGDYQKDSEVCVGPLTRRALQAFSVDKLFFGTDGYSEEGGFTSINLMRAEAMLAMAERANHAILLTDSSKFTHKSTRGVVAGLSLKDTSMIVTDSGIPDEAKSLFKRYGIDLLVVEK